MSTVEWIPIDKIHILNGRSRPKAKFKEITENIAKVGLKKPITVSRKQGSVGFDLVCGQGRLEAFMACGAQEIPAIVVDIPLEDRLLRSLVENLARRTPSSIEIAQRLVDMKAQGFRPDQIAVLVGLSDRHVTKLLFLMEKGEERLVRAVERGDIPIRVALAIATFEDAALRRHLQEAYDAGKLQGRALLRARKLIEERKAQGKALHGLRHHRGGTSAEDLVRTLKREAQKQELLVKKSRLCEQQLRFVLSALKNLMKDEGFVSLLKAEKLDTIPKYLHELMAP